GGLPAGHHRHAGTGAGQRTPAARHPFRSDPPATFPLRLIMPITMFSAMLGLFALSVPIAIAIGLASLLGVALDPTTSMLSVGQQLFISLDKYVLAAIPFFILAGNLMESSGISRRMVDFAKSLVGRMQG